MEPLPRGVALRPFRDDLLAAASQPARRAKLAELLAGFGGDAEIAERLTQWLAEEIEGVLNASSVGDRSIELRAVALARALARVAGAEATDPLWHATESVVAAAASEPAMLDTCVGIGKVTVALLGKTAGGRAKIGALLADEVPRRLRIEAGLALATEQPDPAVGWLTRDYASCDAELKTRILRAFGRARDEASFSFLRSIVGDRGLGVVDPGPLTFEITGALDGIAQRAETAPDVFGVMQRVIEGVTDLDVRCAAVESMGRLPGGLVSGWLCARFDAVGKTLDDPDLGELERERALAEHGATLTALARAWSHIAAKRDPDGTEIVQMGARLRSVFALPAAASNGTLSDRFLAKRVASVDFSWRAELDATEALAVLGHLHRQLPDVAYSTFDGRLLLEMGHRASGAAVGLDVDTTELLLAAGQIALAGEPDREDVESLELSARRSRFALAERQGDWSTCAVLAEAMLADWRTGRLSERAFLRAYGDFDPSAGEDGGARLEAAALQARAYEALAAQQGERARELASEARERLGFSRAALSAQKRPRPALGAAGLTSSGRSARYTPGCPLARPPTHAA